MKIFYFPLVFLFIITSSCKKEREPFERIELSNARYTINCLNCEQHGPSSSALDYSSIRTTLDFSTSRKVNIEPGSYLLVAWKFDQYAGGDYLIDYSELNRNGNTISFNSAWRWNSAHNLHLEMILYSGQGSKSTIASLDIPKPVGANRLSNTSLSLETIPGGFIINTDN